MTRRALTNNTMIEPLDPEDYIADEDPETPTTRRQAKEIEELRAQLTEFRELLKKTEPWLLAYNRRLSGSSVHEDDFDNLWLLRQEIKDQLTRHNTCSHSTSSSNEAKPHTT